MGNYWNDVDDRDYESFYTKELRASSLTPREILYSAKNRIYNHLNGELFQRSFPITELLQLKAADAERGILKTHICNVMSGLSKVNRNGELKLSKLENDIRDVYHHPLLYGSYIPLTVEEKLFTYMNNCPPFDYIDKDNNKTSYSFSADSFTNIARVYRNNANNSNATNFGMIDISKCVAEPEAIQFYTNLISEIQADVNDIPQETLDVAYEEIYGKYIAFRDERSYSIEKLTGIEDSMTDNYMKALYLGTKNLADAYGFDFEYKEDLEPSEMYKQTSIFVNEHIPRYPDSQDPTC